MDNFSRIFVSACAFGLFFSSVSNPMPANARRVAARGPNGSAVGFANQGQYGARAGGRVLGPNQGAGVRAGSYTGAGGGTLQSAGGFGYKRGVGAFRASGWKGTAANGASGSGFTTNKYNAQTGQGQRDSSEQVKSASGSDYGYNGQTNYTKGQGGSSVIQTDNKGTYDVNWAKGQKPTVTQQGQ